jgi:uncharacterized membrane protein
MSLRPAPLAAALVLLLSACGDRDAAPATPAATPEPAAEPVAATPPPPPQRVRGNALMGKDGYGLVPCGTTEQQVVGFDAAAQAALDGFLAGGAREFYIDGWANVGSDGKPVFASIERIYTEGPGCDEKDLTNLVWQARGNEPFWSLTATPQGVNFERPDVPAVALDYAPMVVDGDKRTYTGKSDAGDVVVVVAPGTCSDGMSDTVYGHTATLTVGTETLKGCAYTGLVSE